MKMKMIKKLKLKDLSPTARVYVKNSYLFRLYLHRKQGFVETLRELLLKWYPYRKDINSRPIREELDYESLLKMKEMKNEAALELEESEKKLNTQKKLELESDIKIFLRRFRLGMEWRPTIKFLLITGFFSPPSMNFTVSTDDGLTKERRLRLELNPDTSIDDIKMHWSTIREFQKELYPNFKKVNLTEKKFKNMGIAVADLKIHSREEFSQFDSEKFRKYKAYDLDLAGQLWPDEKDISAEADLKRMNNLRQIRRRFKQGA